MDEATRKRKAEEVRTICLFFNTGIFDPDKTGVLYKFNIKISSSADVNDFVDLAEDDLNLHPTVTVFEQDLMTKYVHRVSCCIIGGGSKLFVVPSEMRADSRFVDAMMKGGFLEVDDLYEMRLSRTDRLHPLQFDFLNNKTDVINTYPRAPKMLPLLIPIQDKVYALSTAFNPRYHYLHPSFEAYNTTKRSWEPLPTPPFYTRLPSSSKINGYAVVTLDEDDDDYESTYIIVSFGCVDTDFFSYNPRSCEWKPVSPAKGAKYPYLYGEAVVIRDVIFAYSPAYHPDDLRAFPFRYCEETDDFSLGSPFSVKGLSMPEPPEMCHIHGVHSTSIAIIRDLLLCLVSTSYPDHRSTQFVHVSIVQIRKDDPSLCDTLNYFTFGISQEGGKFNRLILASCFALAPNVSSIMEQNEEGRNCKNRVVQDITDYDVSSNTEMTSYVM